MTHICWLLAFLFGVLWVSAEFQKRTMKKLMQAYEQRLRSGLVGYDRLWRDLQGATDTRLAVAKARVIVKKSAQHKLNPLKLVDQ